jgi:aryl-alcohol dehydrogenase-like predicted oxidoreductase
MRYRRLGRTELQVSVIGVGTWQFGGEWGRVYRQSEVDEILDRAAECGINLIDTAECYGDHLSESLIGDYLSRRNRSDWIVATKFGHQFHGFLDRTSCLQPQEVQAQLAASLRALRGETVDLYQFHSGNDAAFQNSDLWAMLDRERQAGKIQHLGISVSSKAGDLQAREALQVGAEALQVVYNRLERRAEQDFFPFVKRDDLGLLARVPLASGYLAAKYSVDFVFPANDVRATFEPEMVRRWVAEVETVRQREVPSGIPLSQWALAWCLKNPLVSAVIPGCKDPAQVTANARAAMLNLSDDSTGP